MSASLSASRPARGSAFGWLVWSAGALFFSYAFVHRVSPSVMFDHLMRDFAAGGAILGTLAACYFYAYTAMQIPVGVLLDRLGPRLLLTAAALVCAGGSLLFGLAPSLEVAYLGRLLIGAGAGVSFLSALMLANQWLPSHLYGMISGLTMSIGMIGGFLGQGPLALAIDGWGWRMTMFAGAALGVLIAGAIWAVGRTAAGQPEHGPAAGARRGIGSAFAVALTSRQIWLAALGVTTFSAGILGFAVLWGVPYLMQVHGLPRTAAGLGSSLFLVGIAVGAPAIGWLADRLHRRRAVVIAAAVASTVLWLVLVVEPELPVAAVFALLAALGVLCGATPVCYAVARDAAPPDMRGTATGLVNFCAVAAGAIFQPMLGVLLDLGWDGVTADGVRIFSAAAYANVFIVFAVLMGATALAMIWLREADAGPSGLDTGRASA